MADFYIIREGMYKWMREVVGDSINIIEQKNLYVQRPTSKTDSAQWGQVGFHIQSVDRASLGYNQGKCLLTYNCLLILDLYIRQNMPFKNLDITLQRVCEAWRGAADRRPESIRAVNTRGIRVTPLNDQQIWNGVNLSMNCEYANRG